MKPDPDHNPASRRRDPGRGLLAGFGRLPASARQTLQALLLLSLAGCASSGTDTPAENAGDDSVTESSGETVQPDVAKPDGGSHQVSGDIDPENLDDVDSKYDTDYVDVLSLPRVAAPVATGASAQVAVPIGRNTQEQISPPRGADVQSNLGFFPSLTISATQRTNPARLNGQDDEEDIYWSIVPVLQYRGAIRNRHVYELSLSAVSDSYEELDNLDSENLALGAAVRLDMTEKLKVDLFGSHARSSDPRGSTSTRILTPDIENDEYEETSFGGRVTIGRRTNPLQVVVGLQTADLDFTNNEQDQRDRRDDRFNAGLYLNLTPRTSIFIAGAQTDIEYELPSSRPFDSTNTSVNIGVGWEPTYTTSVLLQAGEAEKKYEQSGFDDITIDNYLGKLTWAPTDHTDLGVYASRSFEESTLRSSPVTVSDIVGLTLGHAFTDAFSAKLYVNWIDDELVDVRQDEILDYGIGLFYDVNRYLSLGASWGLTDRESTDPDAEYESEALSLSATIKPRRSNDFGEPEIQTGADLRSSE